MLPTFADGDVIFLSKNFDKVDGHIYAVDIDGYTVVKRLIFDSDGVLLKSDNPDYADRRLTSYELDNSRILGEVVGSATPDRD